MDIGTKVGPYQISELIGRGGMAEVYKAWNTDLHRHEALKALPPQMTFDPSFSERFLKEARIAAGLRHTHIATIYTVSPATETCPYFTMELVQGGDLADLLHHCGSIPLATALPLLSQISAALDYAHRRGVVHRDVKPANILLENDGHGGWNVKVVDFGIARAQEAGDGARLTKTGMIVGTPEYMSPEQGGSGGKVDHRSDQYSLGVIAYEMLCGRPPFAADAEGTAMNVIMSHIRDAPRAPVDYAPGLAHSANNAVLRVLSKKPEDRFSSCAEFVTALQSEAAFQKAVSRVPHALSQSNPVRVAPLMIVGAIILGVGLISFELLRDNNQGSVPSLVVPPQMAMTTPSAKLASAAEDHTRSQPKEITIAIPSKIPVPEVSEQAVTGLVSVWLAAQNERDIASYASLYAPDFVGVKRTPRGRQTTYHLTEWLKDRGKTLTTADNLNVSVTNQEIGVRPGGAQVSFNQYFKTTKYGDWGPKVLQVRATPQGLRIYREEMLVSFPLK